MLESEQFYHTNIKNISEGVLVSDGDISLAVISDVPILSARLAEGWVSRFYIQKEPIPVLEVEIDREGNFTTDCRWLV